MTQPNGWNEWSKFVLKELERLNSCYDKLDQKATEIQTEIVMLKVKSGVWGAIGGVASIAIVLLVMYIGKVS
jgi:hypothetical protein